MQKGKLLFIVIALLMVANVIMITLFIADRKTGAPPPFRQDNQVDFLLKELQLDSSQQIQLDVLIREHRLAAMPLRENIKNAKQNYFAFLRLPDNSESQKQIALIKISKATEELDVLTFNHFSKLRLLCNVRQQKKFDEIIDDVIQLISKPPPPKHHRDDDHNLKPPPF